MRIAFILQSFPSLSQTFILNQITGLLDLGHEVDIFAECDSKDKKTHPEVEEYKLMERVHYLNIPQNKLSRFFKAIFLIIGNLHKGPIKILKSFSILKNKHQKSIILYTLIPFLAKKFDVIHCHFGPQGIIGTSLKEVGISGEYITSFHGYDVNRYPVKMGRSVYDGLFKNGDLFTANTNFTKKQLLELGCQDKKIIILPESLGVERFKFFERKIQPGELIKILTVGRLVEKKGYEYAIKALVEVIKKHRNIEYIIVGDGSLRTKLELLVKDLSIKNYVKFLGAVEHDEVSKLYEQAHIFILPSVTALDGDREGQALVLQEAQAAGLPVISTLHNGIPEGVIDGKSGFLVPEKGIDALVERIEYIIEHPEIWPEMGRFGRKFVEEKYDTKKLSQQLLNIYYNLIESKQRQR